eukprot:TRINITY_DN5861_c0_g1_i1.p1 TRINITY_DN5861_c0_g1~~TRINITY_DN5861_c0_g1_i1.p1  ORF type:complete len:230 (-),score=58.21 TRINITY_DN5861_c0_g1_i1:188-799(-)
MHLSFKKGDIITVTKRSNTTEWWEGMTNGKMGQFPKNSTQPLSQTDLISLRKTKKADFDVVVIQGYNGTNSLELKEGTIVHVTSMEVAQGDGEDWYQGVDRETGKSGWFPSGQVKILDTEGDESDSQCHQPSSIPSVVFDINPISLFKESSLSVSSSVSHKDSGLITVGEAGSFSGVKIGEMESEIFYLHLLAFRIVVLPWLE